MRTRPVPALVLLPLMTACATTSSGPSSLEGKPPKARVEKSSFGRTSDGTGIDLYTLVNSTGMVAKVTTYGAILTELHVRDRQGKLGDVVLGFDALEGYLKEHPYFGATVGRVANRIAKGVFTLGGKSYKLAVNNGPNHLHGGLKGFDKVVWRAEEVPTKDGVAVRFSYTSPNGEEGYPGALSASVTYTLTDKDELRLDYTATADEATPVNLTNHSYWNLAGEGDILGHVVMINADHFTPVDDTLIPTGEIAPVKGTPMDFTKAMAVGSRIAELKKIGGYDHNYVLNGYAPNVESPAPRLAARVSEPKSGRVLEIWTTEPGVQFYTGNFLDGSLQGKGGRVYQKHAALCLETDHFPDSINHPSFPSVILIPGQKYTQTTIHRFSVE